MAAWFRAAAESILPDRWRTPGRRAGSQLRQSTARLAALGDAIAETELRPGAAQLAAMVFGEPASPAGIAEAERVIVAYLHDRCLIEQVDLLDTEGEPEIAAFRSSLIGALAASAVGILLDRAGTPAMPVDPYPGPVRLLDELWSRVLESPAAGAMRDRQGSAPRSRSRRNAVMRRPA